MAEFAPSRPEERIENNQIEASPLDQKLVALRSYLHWYNQALDNPQKYLGKEELTPKEHDEITELIDKYQTEIDDYIQRQIDEEQDRAGVISYPEDAKAIEPTEFIDSRNVLLLSEMITPKELGEIRPIGSIDPPLAVSIYLTDLSLPAPTGKIPVKSLPLINEPKQSDQQVNINLPQGQKSVPCPLEAEVVEVSQPESIKYQNANVISQLEKPADTLKYQLNLRTELPRVNREEVKPSEEEIKYWQSVFPLPKVLQRLCKESPEDIPSYIGSYVAQNFCYVTNPDFGEFLQYGAEDLPIIMQELKVGHCDYLSWYTVAVLRSQGIPAWIGGGKVTTSDSSQFNGSYNHAVAVYAKGDGTLGELDPTTACSIDFAYHPEVLTKKEIDDLDDKLSNAETDEERRQILGDFKNVINLNRDQIAQDEDLRRQIHEDWADAIGVLRLEDLLNADAVHANVDSRLEIIKNPLEDLKINSSNVANIAERFILNYQKVSEYQRMTLFDREVFKQLVLFFRETNFIPSYDDESVLMKFNNIENPAKAGLTITIDTLLDCYNFQKQGYGVDDWINIHRINLAYSDEKKLVLPISLTSEQIEQIHFSQFFKDRWQNNKIINSSSSPDSFNENTFTVWQQREDQKKYDDPEIYQAVDEKTFIKFIKEIFLKNILLHQAFTKQETRSDILTKLEIDEPKLNKIAEDYILLYNRRDDKLDLETCKILKRIFELTDNEETKLAQTLFPQQEWHLSQNQYGMPVPGPSAREYQPGDDARFIHWKATAKQPNGQLMTREFEPEPEGEAVEIYLDRNIILPESIHDYMGALGVIKAVQARGENSATIHVIQHPEISIQIRPDKDPDDIITTLKDQIFQQETALSELPADSKGFFISTSRMKCAAVNYLHPSLQTICLADEQYWLFPEVREDFVNNGIK